MKPQSTPTDGLLLFQAHFDQLLNPHHPLLKLAGQIDWARLDAAYGQLYCKSNGAPAQATRLMVGPHYLKHTFNESDESVAAQGMENPYWQAFCGYTHLRHELPIHPTSMTRWRQRIGAEKLDELLRQTVVVAVDHKHLPEAQIRQVNVDTTVQEKNVTYFRGPTDSKLRYQAIVKPASAAKDRGVSLRQSYVRVGKRASVMAGRCAHARQLRRMRRELRRLRTWVGRMIRDLRRITTPRDDALTTLLSRCQRLVDQQPTDSNKRYSLHEPPPEVVRCISKGKAHQRYEFGQKVAVATNPWLSTLDDILKPMRDARPGGRAGGAAAPRRRPAARPASPARG